MRKTSLVLAISSLALCAGMQDPAAADRKAVERAVLDYVEGIYDVKPEWIERSVHPRLAKIGYARRGGDSYTEMVMSYEELMRLAGSYNAQGRVPADAPKQVQVLDLLDQTASAKLTAVWGIDYMHLAKFDGRWQIIQVLWQTPPPAGTN
jgi:hypothetical protein